MARSASSNLPDDITLAILYGTRTTRHKLLLILRALLKHGSYPESGTQLAAL